MNYSIVKWCEITIQFFSNNCIRSASSSYLMVAVVSSSVPQRLSSEKSSSSRISPVGATTFSVGGGVFVDWIRVGTGVVADGGVGVPPMLKMRKAPPARENKAQAPTRHPIAQPVMPPALDAAFGAGATVP